AWRAGPWRGRRRPAPPRRIRREAGPARWRRLRRAASRSSRDVGHELHLQDDDGVLDLQLALLEPAKLELVEAAFARKRFDHRIEPPVLERQLGDPALDRFLRRIRIGKHTAIPERT